MLSTVAGSKYAMGLNNKKSSMRRKLPVILGEPIEAVWECPPKEECDIDDLLDFHLDETTRMIQRIWRQDKRIVDFAIVLVARDDNNSWQEVAKVDCCHSQVHLHKRRMNKSVDDIREVLREVTKQEDVENTIDQAFDIVHDQYDQHVREWRYGY